MICISPLGYDWFWDCHSMTEDYNCMGRNIMSLSSSMSNSKQSKELAISVPPKPMGFYQTTRHCNQEDWILMGYYLMHRLCKELHKYLMSLVDTRQILNHLILSNCFGILKQNLAVQLEKYYIFLLSEKFQYVCFCTCGLGNLTPAVCWVLFELWNII
jgi:hypothetical protein